jgi:hypothetical protein
MSGKHCTICHGTGKVGYVIPGDPEPRPFGNNGMTVQTMDGYGTRACECTRDLPAIYDLATWWELESIYSAEVIALLGEISIKAECEVPRNENGRRCHRTVENCYYQALIDLELSRPKVTLFPDTARELAAALIAAAEACDKADEPVHDPVAMS